MWTAKSLINFQDYNSIEFDANGSMIAPKIRKCRNNINNSKTDGVVFGIDENLVEISRPRAIQNGVKLHMNVYIDNVKAIDMDIQKVVNDAKDSGQLAQLLKESWKLDGVPIIENVKCEMHESKVHKEQSVNIQITNNTTNKLS